MKSNLRFTRGFTSMLLIIFLIGLLCLPVLADENQRINLRIEDSPLQEVFRMMAKLAEVNLICDSSVEGTITIDLNNVTFARSLEMITEANNLGYHWMGNTVFVATKDKIKETFTKTRVEVVKLQYKEPDEVSGLLTGMLGELKIEVQPENHQLILQGTEEELEQALEMVKQIDRPLPQVLIEVEITETSLTDKKEVGSSLETGKINFIQDGDTINGLTVDMPEFYKANRDNSTNNILANPSLITLDGQPANLLIGDRVPVKLEHVEDGKLVSTIEYIEAGIKLEFTPRITDDGYIILDVRPQISSLGEQQASGFYRIKTREAQTTLRLKSGETFAIGGLIQSEEIETLKKVPLLGELPILGLLFNSKKTENTKTELVIFITPKVIYPDN